MSLRAMPMIVLNMGSEMLFILNQRLHAQKIDETKRLKVVTDVTKTMFADGFVSALFQEQDVYSAPDVRKIFDRLAHSSIMRLNAKSMSKLYDLMVMGYKRQVLSTTAPRELLAILLNHLESIEDFVAHSGPEADLVRSAIVKAKAFYGSLSLEELFTLRATLLDFYQDSKIRISILLRNATQLGNGQMIIKAIGPVPDHTDVPGRIQYFKPGGEPGATDAAAVACADRHSAAQPSDVFSRDRNCKLGLNIYVDGSSGDGGGGSTAAGADAGKPVAPAAGGGAKADSAAAQPATEAKEQADAEAFGTGGGGGNGAGDGDTTDGRGHARRRSQLIQILNSSAAATSPTKADVSLSFNDYFSKDDDDGPAGGAAASPVMVMHTGEMAIDQRKRASAHKAQLESKLGLADEEGPAAAAHTARAAEAKFDGSSSSSAAGRRGSGPEGKRAEAKDGEGKEEEREGEAGGAGGGGGDDGDDLLSMMDSAGM